MSDLLRPDIQVLTWDPVCPRSASMARELGGSLRTIHYLWYRRPWIAPLKYALQTLATILYLRRRRPRVTIVSNPPPFAALAVWMYHRLHGGDFVVDSHTGVFLEPKWRPFAPLNRFLMRRARLSLVTNETLKSTVDDWGGRGFVLPDALPPIGGSAFALEQTAFNVAAVFSFYEDEPVDEMLAIRDLPSDIHVYVTGDSRKVPASVRAALPPNISLTGFLPRGEYEALLRDCDAVLVLCTRPHTLLCGAYEAVTCGKPLVTSESDDMRAYFRAGTIFVPNTPAGIVAGLQAARTRHAALSEEMQGLRAELTIGWRTTFARFLDLLESPGEIRNPPAGCEEDPVAAARRPALPKGAIEKGSAQASAALKGGAGNEVSGGIF